MDRPLEWKAGLVRCIVVIRQGTPNAMGVPLELAVAIVHGQDKGMSQVDPTPVLWTLKMPCPRPHTAASRKQLIATKEAEVDSLFGSSQFTFYLDG